MAQFKHTIHNFDKAALVMLDSRKNRNGDVVLGNNTVLREIRTLPSSAR